jgi:hypothetical protein
MVHLVEEELEIEEHIFLFPLSIDQNCLAKRVGLNDIWNLTFKISQRINAVKLTAIGFNKTLIIPY